MVDFKKLRASRSQPPAIDPLEIFRRLPKPADIRDLYVSQAEVLKAWFQRREEKDLVVKLHTGGGKTLVGLLIAQSVLNETGRPVIYVTPNNQLTEQALAKAKEYSIPAVLIPPSEEGRRVEFPDEVLSGRATMICNYNHLFTGKSRFGVRGGDREIFSAGAVILDDAHVASSTIRDAYTLEVKDKDSSEVYKALTGTFRVDFKELDKLGTFDDIVAGSESSVLEVPYWAWRARLDQVRAILRDFKFGKFVWPLLRDNLAYCHALVSRTAFTITPILPFVDLIPAFVDSPRRVFMSATIADDSSIIRTFDTSPACLEKPITSRSFAGVGERMILVPELMKNALPFKEVLDAIKLLLTKTVKEYGGAVILVPSFEAAKVWSDVGELASTPKEVAEAVLALQQGKTTGPFIFASRYDGVDLPGDACRTLVVSHLPRGTSDYELCMASSLSNSSTLRSSVAQRIEQGLGRAARGPTDYCVAVVVGRSLVNWLSRRENERFLTGITRAQLKIGFEVSESVRSAEELIETAEKCLLRDPDWKSHHAESLALITPTEDSAGAELRHAALERRALRLFRDGYYEKAIDAIREHVRTTPDIDKSILGWFFQLSARIAEFWDHGDLAQESQRAAFSVKQESIQTPHSSSLCAAEHSWRAGDTNGGESVELCAFPRCRGRTRRHLHAVFPERLVESV
jgi:hypothetical protein